MRWGAVTRVPPRTAPPRAVQEEVSEPVRRVLRWMLSLRDGSGRILCPQHKIEHTGKNAGAIVIACELARLAGRAERDELMRIALEQGRRLVARLEREGNSTCHTFRPGRHDPFNCSNNVIDGGACADALAELVLTFGDRIDPADRQAFVDASVLHAQTYLRYAILDKGIPAQRAWAMTGVAAAWTLARHEVLELATLEGARILEAVQNPDGSYPYHPLESGAAHVGASDVSSFYQSRVTAFLLFSLDRLARNPADPAFRGPILRGLEFLLALQGPDGTKCGLVEAKPWYFGANHEVGSHPFDVHALASGWRHFGHARLAEGADRAFRAWERHIAPDGRPRSHLPGPGRTGSYQCPLFLAGHTSWMARSMEDLVRIRSRGSASKGGGRGLELAVQHFAEASLTRLEDDAVVAWVRGRRPGFNVHHGSPLGSGLLRLYSKSAERDLLARCPLGARNEGEWSGRCGWPAPLRGWRSGGGELRFSLWLARNHWRAGRRAEALLQPFETFRRGVLAFAAPTVSSAFFREPSVHVHQDGVTLRGGLAWRDGAPVPGSDLLRVFRVDGQGLLVEERLVDGGGARAIRYRVPAAASSGEIRETQAIYRLV